MGPIIGFVLLVLALVVGFVGGVIYTSTRPVWLQDLMARLVVDKRVAKLLELERELDRLCGYKPDAVERCIDTFEKVEVEGEGVIVAEVVRRLRKIHEPR